MTADEARAIEVLEKIRELTTSLYPWAPSAVLDPELPYALGSIRVLCDRAIARARMHDARPKEGK